MDGADTPIAHIVKGVALSKNETGIQVKAVFAKKTTGTIMDIDHFRAIDDTPKFETAIPMMNSKSACPRHLPKPLPKPMCIFAGISGDFNPMHMNEEFAKLTPFGTRIAHGALPRA
ncbi:MAG: MaoC/PaaZ C-terminal domain-containing protein [Desulfobacterales bacterium]